MTHDQLDDIIFNMVCTIREKQAEGQTVTSVRMGLRIYHELAAYGQIWAEGGDSARKTIMGFPIEFTSENTMYLGVICETKVETEV